jgi:ATP-binding cassette, subfamily C (CFTR/MRP), member 4
MCNWGLRQTAELENQMISVERVIEYSNLPNERIFETKDNILNKMSSDWPKNGIIKFVDVSLRYSENSEIILNNLNFTIHENVSMFDLL